MEQYLLSSVGFGGGGDFSASRNIGPVPSRQLVEELLHKV